MTTTSPPPSGHLLEDDLVAIRARRGAIAGAFFVQGLLFISLTLRLPVVQRTFDLDELEVSGIMLMMVLLAGAGSFMAEKVAARAGSIGTVRLAVVLLAAGIVGVGVGVDEGSFTPFVLCLAVYGTGVGVMDAAMNMQALALEHRLGRPLMPSFHGAWTAGGLAATVVTLAVGDIDLRVGGMVLAALALALLAAPLIRHDVAPPQDASRIGVSWRSIALIGAGLVLFYMVDSATAAWGPIYLSSSTVFDDPPTSSQMFALATLPYLAATLLARIVGDAATARLGIPTMLRIGAVVTSVGLGIVVLAPASTWQVAIVGFFVVGLGVAVIAPLSFSAAAAVAGGDDLAPAARQARVDSVIARFNQFNYVGALLGAVLTGVVGSSNLRIGFAVPMVLILAMVPLARHFAPRR